MIFAISTRLVLNTTGRFIFLDGSNWEKFHHARKILGIVANICMMKAETFYCMIRTY